MRGPETEIKKDEPVVERELLHGRTDVRRTASARLPGRWGLEGRFGDTVAFAVDELTEGILSGRVALDPSDPLYDKKLALVQQSQRTMSELWRAQAVFNFTGEDQRVKVIAEKAIEARLALADVLQPEAAVSVASMYEHVTRFAQDRVTALVLPVVFVHMLSRLDGCVTQEPTGKGIFPTAKPVIDLPVETQGQEIDHGALLKDELGTISGIEVSGVVFEGFSSEEQAAIREIMIEGAKYLRSEQEGLEQTAWKKGPLHLTFSRIDQPGMGGTFMDDDRGEVTVYIYSDGTGADGVERDTLLNECISALIRGFPGEESDILADAASSLFSRYLAEKGLIDQSKYQGGNIEAWIRGSLGIMPFPAVDVTPLTMRYWAMSGLVPGDSSGILMYLLESMNLRVAQTYIDAGVSLRDYFDAVAHDDPYYGKMGDAMALLETRGLWNRKIYESDAVSQANTLATTVFVEERVGTPLTLHVCSFFQSEYGDILILDPVLYNYSLTYVYQGAEIQLMTTEGDNIIFNNADVVARGYVTSFAVNMAVQPGGVLKLKMSVPKDTVLPVSCTGLDGITYPANQPLPVEVVVVDSVAAVGNPVAVLPRRTSGRANALARRPAASKTAQVINVSRSRDYVV